MNTQRLKASVSEIVELQSTLHIASDMKHEAHERMLNAGSDATAFENAAREYAFASGEVNRINARIRVLKGRVHFDTGIRPPFGLRGAA